jgi:hypothetical protein
MGLVRSSTQASVLVRETGAVVSQDAEMAEVDTRAVTGFTVRTDRLGGGSVHVVFTR